MDYTIKTPFDSRLVLALTVGSDLWCLYTHPAADGEPGEFLQVMCQRPQVAHTTYLVRHRDGTLSYGAGVPPVPLEFHRLVLAVFDARRRDRRQLANDHWITTDPMLFHQDNPVLPPRPGPIGVMVLDDPEAADVAAAIDGLAQALNTAEQSLPAFAAGTPAEEPS